MNRTIDPIKIKLFLPGKQIYFQGQLCTVDHIHIKHHELMIKFEELDKPIDSNNIDCEYELLDLNREW